jgi:hypothetical protein
MVLFYRVSQFAAGFETGNFPGFDFDGLTGLRIAALASGSFGNGEGAESDQCNLVSLRQSIGDTIQHAVQCLFSGGFADARSIRHVVDQFTLVHTPSSFGFVMVCLYETVTFLGDLIKPRMIVKQKKVDFRQRIHCFQAILGAQIAREYHPCFLIAQKITLISVTYVANQKLILLV